MDFFFKKVKWLGDYYGNPTAYYPLKTPGVTTILSTIPDPDYESFVKDVGEEKAKVITQGAWDRGTALHTFLEHFIIELAKSKDPSKALQYTQVTSNKLLKDQNIPSDKIDKGRDLFFNFYYSDYANTYIDLIGTELNLYSPSLFYRGKADVFFKESYFGRVITDFKTSSKPVEKGTVKERKYKLQLGAYALAAEHMFKNQNVNINKASILVIQTNSTLIQEICCIDEDLKNQKNEFSKLVKQWHIDNNQDFLFN